MKTKIVFDLDGVLRNLVLYLYKKLEVPIPSTWFWKYKGKDVFDWIKEDGYLALSQSPPTQYAIELRPHIKEIRTQQPKRWIPSTVFWVRRHIGSAEIYFMTTREKEAELRKRKNTLLVEDYPLFSSYKNILLIDMPYNRNIKAERIYKPGDILRWMG